MSEHAIEQAFEHIIASSLAKAYSKEGMILDEFGIHINTKETDGLEAVKERAESGGDVTAAEVGMLLDAGWVTFEEYEELIDEVVGES